MWPDTVSVDNAPSGQWFDPNSAIYGPQTDGTYNIPSAAQQSNNPANTAGWGASISPQVSNLLSQGLGIAGQAFNLSQMLDYRKYEATQGGLFVQGQGSYMAGRPVAVNPNVSMLLLLVVGIVIMAKR